MMSPEMREKLIRLIASFPAHERDLGPDNEVFADVIPLDGAELGDCPKPIERLADAILSLLATLGAGEGWRPIESAPKDGTRLIVCGPAWNGERPDDPVYVTVGAWSDCGWVEDDGSSELYPPTHWMPLPARPE